MSYQTEPDKSRLLGHSDDASQTATNTRLIKCL